MEAATPEGSHRSKLLLLNTRNFKDEQSSARPLSYIPFPQGCVEASLCLRAQASCCWWHGDVQARVSGPTEVEWGSAQRHFVTARGIFVPAWHLLTATLLPLPLGCSFSSSQLWKAVPVLFAVYCMCFCKGVAWQQRRLQASLVLAGRTEGFWKSPSQGTFCRSVWMVGGEAQRNDQARSEPSERAKLASWETGESSQEPPRGVEMDKEPGWGGTKSAASQPAPELVNWNQPGRKDMTVETGWEDLFTVLLLLFPCCSSHLGPTGRLAPVCALNRSEWLWGVVGREGVWPEGKEWCHRLQLGSGSRTDAHAGTPGTHGAVASPTSQEQTSFHLVKCDREGQCPVANATSFAHQGQSWACNSRRVCALHFHLSK